MRHIKKKLSREPSKMPKSRKNTKKTPKITKISAKMREITKKTPKKQVFSLLSWTYGQKNRLIAKNSVKTIKVKKWRFRLGRISSFRGLPKNTKMVQNTIFERSQSPKPDFWKIPKPKTRFLTKPPKKTTETNNNDKIAMTRDSTSK